MKKIFFLFFAISLLGIASCSDDGGSSSGGASNLSKVRIKNASSLLTTSSTRSTTSDILLKQNADGSVSPVYFIKENGDSLTMAVSAVRPLGSRYLLMSGSFMVKGQSYYQILVDKNTESIYAFPNVDGMNTTDSVYTDNNGNIYFKGYETGGYSNMIYKLDISDLSNLTLSNYLPSNQIFTGFMLNKAGVCFYGNISAGSSNGSGKLKLPSGTIIPLSASTLGDNDPMSVFIGSNGAYYVLTVVVTNNVVDWSHYKILKLDLTNNALSYTVVADFYGFRNSCLPSIQINPIKHTHCFITEDGVIDFNETTNAITKYPQAISGSVIGQTASSFILNSATSCHITKMSMSNYTASDVALATTNSQEIYTITTSPSSNTITFSSLRYSDGQNVIGTLNAQDVATYQIVAQGKPTILAKLY
jgi:hypothetical protein